MKSNEDKKQIRTPNNVTSPCDFVANLATTPMTVLLARTAQNAHFVEKHEKNIIENITVSLTQKQPINQPLPTAPSRTTSKSKTQVLTSNIMQNIEYAIMEYAFCHDF